MPAWFLTGDRDGAVLSPASSSSFISGAVHCVKPEETGNPNRMFVFAEKHPASVTLTNAVFFGQDALSEIPLQSHIQLPQLTEKMKTLLEGVCVGGIDGWVGWGFWGFLVVVRWGFQFKK